VVLVDVDGTISLRTDRDPFEWRKVGSDIPYKAVVDLLNDLVSLGQNLVFLSGRDESIRAETEFFIKKNILGTHDLHMREIGDSRPDEVVKLEIYNREILGKYQVRFVLDDRDKVVKLWREGLGLATFQVNRGDF
jgi:hypothetical protein